MHEIIQILLISNFFDSGPKSKKVINFVQEWRENNREAKINYIQGRAKKTLLMTTRNMAMMFVPLNEFCVTII